MQTMIRTACHQVCEHIGCCGVPAAVQLGTADEKQGLCNIAFACTRIAGKNETLFSSYKVQFCKFHYMGLIHSSLEGKVEIRKQFSLRQS